MMSTFLRWHWPAVVVALAVGFVSILPPLAAKVRFGVDFSSPVNIRAADEFFYLARIREVLDGHPTIGNAYLWEHKDSPPAPVFVGEWLLAQPMRIAGGAVVAWDVGYDFLLPALAALLTYIGFFSITRLRWLSLLGTAFLFWGMFPTEFSRAVSPQLNFLFWLSFFLITYCLLGDQTAELRRKSMLVAAATANFGLLFYLYPYYWTFYLAAFAIFAVGLFLRRDVAPVKTIALVVGGGLVLALPYFVMTARAMALPEYGAALRRLGMIESHFPSGIFIVLPALLALGASAVLVWLRFISWDRQAAFLVSGLLAAALSVNQHVLTGRNFEFSSHYFMLAVFWFAFFGAFLIAAAWRKLPRGRVILAGLLTAVVALTIVWRGPGPAVASAWREPPAESARLAGYAPVFEWLQRYAPADAVVLTSAELSELIPIYTSQNVYFASPVRAFVLSDAEVLDRFVLATIAEPLDEETVRRNFRSIFGNRTLDAALHAAQENRVRAVFGLRPKPVEPIPVEDVARVLARRRELAAGDIASELAGYRLDYVIWDRTAASHAFFEKLDFLEKVDDIGAFRIYRLR